MHYKRIRHAHNEKLLCDTLQSVLVAKLPPLSTKWIRNALKSALGGEVVHVPSSSHARMLINFTNVFCFKNASRFATSLGAFSHSARTTPIITVIIQVTTLKTNHLRNHALSIQKSKIQTFDACHGSQGPKFCPV